MDRFWQSFLGLQQPTLPTDLCSEHFTHDELEELLQLWGGGNVLSDPSGIADMAEKAYAFESDEQYFADPGIKQMWRDGLGRFLTGLWKMVATKKGYTICTPRS